MSERNGDKARFGRERRQKILRRRQTRESQKVLQAKNQVRPALGLGEEGAASCR